MYVLLNHTYYLPGYFQPVGHFIYNVEGVKISNSVLQ